MYVVTYLLVHAAAAYEMLSFALHPAMTKEASPQPQHTYINHRQLYGVDAIWFSRFLLHPD